ncbi:hypothetical protein ACIQYS_09605 [Psychrobacillus sp. NPDC096426]
MIWIPGAGFYYVQPSGPINEAENERQLELVKRNIEEAEIKLGMRKEKSA